MKSPNIFLKYSKKNRNQFRALLHSKNESPFQKIKTKKESTES